MLPDVRHVAVRTNYVSPDTNRAVSPELCPLLCGPDIVGLRWAAIRRVMAPHGSDMNARILVVDDDPGIRSLVADFLARYGYQVEGAADAAAAERALARTAFEVAILDVMIPG